MKQLNQYSTNVLNRMVGMMNRWCIKIDNSEGGFLPIFISINYEDDKSKVFVMGHYSSVDGDILAEPEMHFLFDICSGIYFSVYYRQDCLDVEQSSARIDEGEIISVNRLLQAEHTEFANQWLKNIRLQQNL